MPLLSEDDQRRMLGPAGFICQRCGLQRYKNYCRQCDQFFYECRCPPDDDDDHTGHRTYDSGFRRDQKMPIITSMLDNDLYKFTMQRAVLGYKQKVPVRYVFNNRRPDGKFNDAFMEQFNRELAHMGTLHTINSEIGFLVETCSFLGAEYLQYLHNFRYKPEQVTAKLVGNGDLELEINGPWEETILWEVPLMAIISELYFNYCDDDWERGGVPQDKKLRQKAEILQNVTFADFGTRRRRSYETQDMVVRFFKHLCPRNFVGTSNVHLAHKHEVKPLGTMAHEWIMGVSALEGLKHANRHALKIWSDVYKGDLGTALPDTFGSEAFFGDFDSYLARLFDGVRHDSDDPIKFMERVVKHYKSLRIDPMTKTIIFSDGLTSQEAQRISHHCHNRIRCSFGIGTHFTNDYDKPGGLPSKALNMVIKLSHCAGVPVVKLSDNPGKAIGDKDALRVAKWTFFGTPLDAAQ